MGSGSLVGLPFDKEHLRWEMVGVAAEKTSAGISAPRQTTVFLLRLFQELYIHYFGTYVTQP